MSSPDRLPSKILEHGDILGRDRAGKTFVLLALDDAALDELLCSGADAAEAEESGDDEPYAVPPVHLCWFEAA